MPSIRFFLANTDHPIQSGHGLWHQPLADRKAPGSPDAAARMTAPLTYGGYFKAISGFCASRGWESIRRAAQKRLHRPVAEEDVGPVSIFLEKHGAFYHPGRIAVVIQKQTLSFVINVAASAEGRRSLPIEIQALERLGEKRPFGWLPTVYAGTIDPIPMFLGDWFDGYHEFHLTRSTKKKDLSLIVWDGAEPPCLLSDEQAADLYRQATMILTACYDPVTTDQIFPWHHAAGDFVVGMKDQAVDVKLITVRDYCPFFEMKTAPADEGALLGNLLVFFLHLSIRMRLDRLDGVSEIVWAPDTCLAPIVDGFFKGLDLSGRLCGFPDSFASFFQAFFNHQGQAQSINTAAQAAVAVFDRQREERRIVELHMARHLRELCLLVERHQLT